MSKGVRARAKPKAATSDILGGSARIVRVPAKRRKHYERLTELLELLVQRQADLAQAAREELPSYSMHMADAGTDSYDRGFALGMLSSEADAVFEVEEALRRIRDGTYGICQVTGKPIEPARLEAIPWTRFSAVAEKQLEREVAIKHARLNPRQSVKELECAGPSEEED